MSDNFIDSNSSKRSNRRIALLAFAMIGSLTFVYFIGEGLLIAWMPVVARAATTNDKVYPGYFGIDDGQYDETPIQRTVRNIGVVEGCFSKRTWLSICQYEVRSGAAVEKGAITVGRSPNIIGAPKWILMKHTIAIGESLNVNQRYFQVGSEGHSRGGGRGNQALVDFAIVESKTFTGWLRNGYDYLLHVEGDRPFAASRNDSIQRFAQKNSGNFIVIVVRLH